MTRRAADGIFVWTLHEWKRAMDLELLDASRCDCPRVTVDVVIFTLSDNDLQVLLSRRNRWPCEGCWALPGALVGPDEPLEAAASSRLMQTLGLSRVFMEQLYTFGEPRRDPRHRVITVAYWAIVPPGNGVRRGTADETQLRWWSVYRLPPLAFDHARILDYALTRLRNKLEYTAVGFELVPEEFTLSELQAAYQIVLGETLDKRNFRRKILSAGVIEPSGRKRGGEGRPAWLYRYRPSAVAEIKARRLFP